MFLIQLTAALAADTFVSDTAELVAAIGSAPASSTSSTPDDHVIWLMPGTYAADDFDLHDKVLTLRALVPRTAILSGRTGGAVRLLRIRGSTRFRIQDVVVDGDGREISELANDTTGTFSSVVFRNGASVRNDWGGVARINTNETIWFEGCRFEQASSPYGGHLYVKKGTLVVDHSSFLDGHAVVDGGCLYAEDDITIRDTDFEGCGQGAVATARGGALHLEGGEAMLERVWIRDSVADAGGAGLWTRTDTTVRSSLFCRNEATGYTGAGLVAVLPNDGRLTVEDTLFLGNTSPPSNTHWGTSLRIEGQEFVRAQLHRNGFIGNDGAGAAVIWSSLQVHSRLFLEDSLMAWNIAGVQASAVHQATALQGVPSRFRMTRAVGWPDAPTGWNFSVTDATLWDPGFADPGPGTCTIDDVVPTVPGPLTAAQTGPFGVDGLVDTDGDGVYSPEDCDDTDPLVFPGAAERCNGLDDDCDRLVDEDLPPVELHLDADGDGQGTGPALAWCGPREHLVTNDWDCDDTDPTTVAELDYVDGDGDGFGVGDPVPRCTTPAPPGVASVGGDCDDDEPAAAPGRDETCDGLDTDCNDLIDDQPDISWWLDSDQDGFGVGPILLSCVSPGSLFVLEDGRVDCDDDDVDVTIERDWWLDVDDDGAGAGSIAVACTAPSDDHIEVVGTMDCDDAEPLRTPGRVETCDGLDNDCDGDVDEDLSLSVYYADVDEDGHGDPATSEVGCALPDGFVTSADDCDDSTDLVAPGRPEVCDGRDNDCNGVVDEQVSSTWYLDADGDGHGDPANSLDACTQPIGYVPSAGDCDDQDGSINAGAEEVCDGRDNDCDALIDESGTDVPWYADADGDGHGDPDDSVEQCIRPDGHVTNPTDCDDADPAVNPDAADDDCDELDDDCDGTADEDAPVVDGYVDSDADGYPGTLEPGRCPTSTSPTDCADDDPSINPGAEEVCGPLDRDCNRVIGDEQLDCGPPAPPPRGCTCDQGSPPGIWELLQSLVSRRRQA